MIEQLLERYDDTVFDVGARTARVRIEGAGDEVVDVVIDAGGARLAPVEGRADAVLQADPQTWKRLAADVRGGMDAFRAGRLRVRRDLHLGIGFLAATSGGDGLRFRHVETRVGSISVMEGGPRTGPAAVLLHGLGATKASFLPTVAAFGAAGRRTVAVDLPGFGDSVKPLRGAYDPPFFARAVVALLDALELDDADLVGNSMGGRVALEVGMAHPDRARRLGLLAPSLAWLRSRPWAPLLRYVPPQLGAIQPAPRPVVERIVRQAVGDDGSNWTAAGLDEFLRSYLTPAGRVAFYAAARNIVLEEPRGKDGFWTRLERLETPALFVWGRKDTLVPIGFARHVRRVVPRAEHLELDCGHVPQLEKPKQTHAALVRFFGA